MTSSGCFVLLISEAIRDVKQTKAKTLNPLNNTMFLSTISYHNCFKYTRGNISEVLIMTRDRKCPKSLPKPIITKIIDKYASPNKAIIDSVDGLTPIIWEMKLVFNILLPTEAISPYSVNRPQWVNCQCRPYNTSTMAWHWTFLRCQSCDRCEYGFLWAV